MLDVITLGTVTRDVFIQSPLFKVLKERSHIETIGLGTGEVQCFALGSKIRIEQPIFAGGGGAHNSAVTFARHGLKTAILGSVGNDLAGKEIIRSIKAEKITSLMRVDGKNGTGYSAILLAPGGERTILVYRGASDTLKAQDIPHGKMRARWVYIAPGEIPYSVIMPFVARLKKKGTRIAMNPSQRYLTLKKTDIETLFSVLDVVIVNREEASQCVGVPREDDRKIFKEFDRLCPGIAVVTDGRNGALVSDGSYLYKAKIFPEKNIIDRTGAGDAFGSGFVAGIARKNDIGYALRFASANATSVVESIGATSGILTAKEISRPRWKNFDLDVDRL